MLLILDGLEPLQNTRGELRDKMMSTFLRVLGRNNKGLCLITTRIKISDLQGIDKKFVANINLEKLDDDEGVSLFRHYEVEGTDDELITVVQKFGGHALSLNLLGSLLKDQYGGDVRFANEIELLPRGAEDKDDSRRHAFTVIKAYEDWFGENDPKTEALRLLGLFDRPAESRAIEAIRKSPAISGLSDSINSKEMNQRK